MNIKIGAIQGDYKENKDNTILWVEWVSFDTEGMRYGLQHTFGPLEAPVVWEKLNDLKTQDREITLEEFNEIMNKLFNTKAIGEFDK